jgi:hypothetical protein
MRPAARAAGRAATLLAIAAAMAGCRGEGQVPEETAPDIRSASPQAEFWRNLAALCPGAAEGELLRAPDQQIDPAARLVVHFWECGPDELRFPLHVGEDRSRTWVFIHHADRLELRHDHRNPDGTEEANTWYGAATVEPGTARWQEFVFERDGMIVGWRVEIEPGRRFTYGTIRDGDWRHHLEFDLTRSAEVPPLPWGHETRPSQRP